MPRRAGPPRRSGTPAVPNRARRVPSAARPLTPTTTGRRRAGPPRPLLPASGRQRSVPTMAKSGLEWHIRPILISPGAAPISLDATLVGLGAALVSLGAAWERLGPVLRPNPAEVRTGPERVMARGSRTVTAGIPTGRSRFGRGARLCGPRVPRPARHRGRGRSRPKRIGQSLPNLVAGLSAVRLRRPVGLRMVRATAGGSRLVSLFRRGPLRVAGLRCRPLRLVVESRDVPARPCLRPVPGLAWVSAPGPAATPCQVRAGRPAAFRQDRRRPAAQSGRGLDWPVRRRRQRLEQ